MVLWLPGLGFDLVRVLGLVNHGLSAWTLGGLWGLLNVRIVYVLYRLEATGLPKTAERSSKKSVVALLGFRI